MDYGGYFWAEWHGHFSMHREGLVIRAYNKITRHEKRVSVAENGCSVTTNLCLVETV